jgi:hypothetical protein
MTFKSLAALGLVLASVLALPALDASAQGVSLSSAAPRLSTQAAGVTADPNQIADLLRSQGLAVQIATDNQGDPLLRTRSQGVTWNVYFYGCTNGQSCTAITFESTYQPSASITPETLNSWSLNKRYAYAVRRADGINALRMDVLMVGGINGELWQETHNLWERQLGAFLRHIGY